MESLNLKIEKASLGAWPALQQVLFDGWILRFSDGYTKRANSINPLYVSHLEIDRKIRICEGLYAARGLPAIFRLLSFVEDPMLDRELERRSYRSIDPTSVMYMRRDEFASTPASGKMRFTEDLDAWMGKFSRMSDGGSTGQATHRNILRTIGSRLRLVEMPDGDQVVACALGVLDEDVFGIFDMVTDPARRGEGIGSDLVRSMLAWARDNGAEHAFLQVVDSNQAAVRLYEKVGFRRLYGYWYRVPS